MSCEKLPAPPPLPGLGGGVGLPTLTIPDLSLSANFCCLFNFEAYITAPNIPGIPILGAALTAIMTEVALLDSYLSALDLVNIDCPIE